MSNNYGGIFDRLCGMKCCTNLRPMKEFLREKCSTFGIDTYQVFEFPYKTATHLEEIFGSKLHGYKCHMTYRREMSSCWHIKDIKTPTFMYFSNDDPIIGHNAVEWDGIRANENIVLGTTDHGSHLCCLEDLKSQT